MGTEAKNGGAALSRGQAALRQPPPRPASPRRTTSSPKAALGEA